ncbi:MAG: hypothetical protein ABI672_09425 [Vicinamibacteria bacterium]
MKNAPNRRVLREVLYVLLAVLLGLPGGLMLAGGALSASPGSVGIGLFLLTLAVLAGRAAIPVKQSPSNGAVSWAKNQPSRHDIST